MIVFCVILSLIWIISLFCDMSFLGVSTTSAWFTPFTYMFYHKNILHLALNIYCIYIMHKNTKNLYSIYRPKRNDVTLLIIAIIFSALAGYLAQQDKMTIGASAIAYFYIGFILSQCYNNLKYILSVIIFLILANCISFLVGNNALLVHFLGFAFGASYGAYLIYEYRRNHIGK